MKKIIFALLGLVLGIIGTFVFISVQNKVGHAVIVSAATRPGTIVAFSDRNHVFISIDDDTIPEYITKVDEQMFGDIVYQKNKNTLNNISVVSRTINGLGYIVTDYTYLDEKITLHPIYINSVSVAREEDNLLVIDSTHEEVDTKSSFIGRQTVDVADYHLIADRY